MYLSSCCEADSKAESSECTLSRDIVNHMNVAKNFVSKQCIGGFSVLYSKAKVRGKQSFSQARKALENTSREKLQGVSLFSIRILYKGYIGFVSLPGVIKTICAKFNNKELLFLKPTCFYFLH